jgi:hypothetical protein
MCTRFCSGIHVVDAAVYAAELTSGHTTACEQQSHHTTAVPPAKLPEANSMHALVQDM